MSRLNISQDALQNMISQKETLGWSLHKIKNAYNRTYAVGGVAKLSKTDVQKLLKDTPSKLEEDRKSNNPNTLLNYVVGLDEEHLEEGGDND